jgi:hypothetical protein
MGNLTISMAIFNSYVKLPEGRGLTSYKNGEKDDFGLECWGIEFTSGYNQHKRATSTIWQTAIKGVLFRRASK